MKRETLEPRSVTSLPFLIGFLVCVGFVIFFIIFSVLWSYRAWIGIPLAGIGMVAFALGIQQESAENLVEACRKDIARILSKRGPANFQVFLNELPWNPEILRAVLELMHQAGEVRWVQRNDRVTLLKQIDFEQR